MDSDAGVADTDCAVETGVRKRGSSDAAEPPVGQPPGAC
jgi:hypothetical protein